MLLPIGATIRCRDGEAGRLKYVVIDPDDGTVTHLIVERGVLLRYDIVVPAAWVERSSEHKIALNATLAELNALPEYREFDFIEPDPNYHPPSGHRVEETRLWLSPYVGLNDDLLTNGRPWLLRHVRLGVQDDEVIVRRGLPVQTSDGRNAGVVDHLVVDPASLRTTHLVVRRGWLWNTQARIVPLERVAEVTDYGVRLNLSQAELDQAPLYQPPASDAEIAAQLQRALETDLRTRAAGLRVQVQGGVVRFIGSAIKEVMEAARAIARQTRGVIGFADEVSAPSAPPLRIGAPVHALDGRYGTLAKVVVDPHARRVTHMIVRKGWLLAEDRVIPIERVARVDKDGIYLNAPAAELNQHPRYREETFVEPLPGWEEVPPYAAADTLFFWHNPYLGVAPPIMPVIEHVVNVGVPGGEVVLRRGADVTFKSESVGTLDHMLFDPTSGDITHFVVQGKGRGRVIVPVEWVSELDQEAIVLARWEPDQPGVPAHEATHDDAASAAPSTPGARDEAKPLDPDTVLFGRVTAALKADPRTASIPIEVIADRGVITLEGTVPSPAIKTAAEAIARHVPGVVTVINELEIRQPERAPEPVAVIPPVRNE